MALNSCTNFGSSEHQVYAPWTTLHNLSVSFVHAPWLSLFLLIVATSFSRVIIPIWKFSFCLCFVMLLIVVFLTFIFFFFLSVPFLSIVQYIYTVYIQYIYHFDFIPLSVTVHQYITLLYSIFRIICLPVFFSTSYFYYFLLFKQTYPENTDISLFLLQMRKNLYCVYTVPYRFFNNPDQFPSLICNNFFNLFPQKKGKRGIWEAISSW